MPFTRIFRIPDYYTSFACKCGNCVNTCCHGWAITISMTEFFRLSGMNCSDSLRRALDCAILLVDNPTKERYATFNTDWRGDCRLHRESDGLCAIQYECGEEPLPAICRMYPRAVRTRYDDECCCSAGCEAVAELLMERTTPLVFVERELTVPLEPERPDRDSRIAKLYRPVRNHCIEILQHGKLPLESRIAALSQLASELDAALNSPGRIDGFMLPDALYYIESAGSYSAPFDLPTAKLLSNWFGQRSASLYPYSQAAAEYYGTDCELTTYLPDPAMTAGLYDEANARRENFDQALENLLVNEVFISGFPFNSSSPTDAALALRALYLMLRYITAAIDGSAFAVFRVANNTNFYNVAPRLMRGISAERKP